MANQSRLPVFLPVGLVLVVACSRLPLAPEMPTPVEVTRTRAVPVEIEMTDTIERPVAIEVHLWQTYSRDQVQIKIDEQVIFFGEVTTDDILSLASTIPVTISEGSHRIGVTVNDSVEEEAKFGTEDLAVIAVSYSPEEEEVSFEFLDFRPAYH